MASSTSEELSAIEDQLSGEKLLITKLKTYSQDCSDPQLKQRYEDLACRHQQHYDKLLGFLNQEECRAMNQSQNQSQAQTCMKDQEVLRDMLSSQKIITGTYNAFTNECVTPQIRDEFMNVLDEEHQLQVQIFDEIHRRGQYPAPAAEQQKVDQAKQKFQNMNQNG